MDLYIFVGIGLFGFLLIVLSFVMGEVGHLGDLGHFSLEHDADLCAGHDGVGLDHADAPGPLSTRVVSIFLTTFGSVAAGSRLYGLNPLTSAAMGLAAGYGLGWLMWRVMRLLWAQGGSSEIRAQDLVGCLGEVTVAIPAAGPGQVACIVDGTRTYQIARAVGGAEIPLGSPARVVEVTAEGVLVEPATGEDPVPDGPTRRVQHA